MRADDVPVPGAEACAFDDEAQLLVGLAEGFFDEEAFGDVGERAAEEEATVLADGGRDGVVNPDDAAVGGDHAVLEAARGVALDLREAVLHRVVAVVGVDVGEPEAGGEPVGQRVTEVCGGGRDVGECVGGDVELPDDDFGLFDEEAVAFVAGFGGGALVDEFAADSAEFELRRDLFGEADE